MLGGAGISQPTTFDGNEINDFFLMDFGDSDFDPLRASQLSDVANDSFIDINRRGNFVNTTDLLEYRHADNEQFSDDY